MDFRELSYITAIARAGSITRAAQELHITQPSLSHFLQQTEAAYGLALFRRVGRRYLPTDAGAVYLEGARDILERKEALDNRLARLQDPDSGSFRVGFAPMRAAFVLPRVLPGFRRRYPHVSLRVQESVGDELESQLDRGEVDLAFYDVEKLKPTLNCQVLRRDEILLALPLGHPALARALPLADGGPPFLPLGEVRQDTFLLLTESQRLGRYGRAALRRQLPGGARTQTLGNLRAAIELVSQGYGVSFTYDSLLQNMGLKSKVATCCFEKSRLFTDFVAMHPAGAPLPRCAPDFIRLVHDALL